MTSWPSWFRIILSHLSIDISWRHARHSRFIRLVSHLRRRILCTFGTFLDSLGQLRIISAPKASDILFEKNIRREILSFVKTGKPNTTKWDTSSVNRALLTNLTEVVDSYNNAQCSYWTLKAGMWSYAWIN